MGFEGIWRRNSEGVEFISNILLAVEVVITILFISILYFFYMKKHKKTYKKVIAFLFLVFGLIFLLLGCLDGLINFPIEIYSLFILGNIGLTITGGTYLIYYWESLFSTISNMSVEWDLDANERHQYRYCTTTTFLVAISIILLSEVGIYLGALLDEDFPYGEEDLHRSMRIFNTVFCFLFVILMSASGLKFMLRLKALVNTVPLRLTIWITFASFIYLYEGVEQIVLFTSSDMFGLLEGELAWAVFVFVNMNLASILPTFIFVNTIRNLSVIEENESLITTQESYSMV